jgi:preprotein translocase subunit YajC
MDPTSLVLIALMIVAFYFLILRPQKKRQQAIQQTLRSLAPGSRVLLGSGLFGTLVSIGDRQAVLEISPGVHLTVLKQAIIRTATEADEDSPVDELDDDELDDLDETAPLVDPAISTQGPAGPTLGGGSTGAHSLDGTDASAHPSAGADPNRRA